MLSDLTGAVHAGREDWTEEQRHAIERRDGELFLDAAAGSGKTSVLVERFARAVLEDGVDPARILTITFTEKAAAEMRERIRGRLRELGATEAARATEGAFISTIHGFCARVVRAHALTAGVDPAFVVLDEPRAARLARSAFEEALEELARTAGGAEELIASYGVADLRGAVLGTHAQLRSQGQLEPSLPVVSPGPELAPLLARLHAAARALVAELETVTDPSQRVLVAVQHVGEAARFELAGIPWPGQLAALGLPGGNGAALRTERCLHYSDALMALRNGCAHHLARGAREVFDQLLRGYGALYEQRKRELSGLDFADLELLCNALVRSAPELRDRYRERFHRVMVDELQDTNGIQMELIESVADGNLFTVGDAQQSIYGFRHADVRLFERRGMRLEAEGARATLQVNFRARPEILDVLNRCFAPLLGERFVPLRAGRALEQTADARVELLIVDRAGEPGPEERPVSWRLIEAEFLARRVRSLLEEGVAPGEVVVLTRATTDMRTYEQALERVGVPTYVIGGRGYWKHPQVLDMVAYLRVLANPRDDEALYTLLASPLVGASYDAMVLVGAAARARGISPWNVLVDGIEDGRPEMAVEDRRRIAVFTDWIRRERAGAARLGIQELLERALERTGYDLVVLSLPGGQRRMANIRKLMRLGREHDAAGGPDLRSFLDLAAERASRSGGPAGEQESEAPVESEALDAVRLMTIHRAKGLEFPVVCVADLGRAPRSGGEVLRVSQDGRLGLRLARPGTGAREPALEYEALGEEQRAAQEAEERRLFYVAATRARERLIFSGVADVRAVWAGRQGPAPIGWLGPALVPELEAEVREGVRDGVRFAIALAGEVAPAPVGLPSGHSSPPPQSTAEDTAVPAAPAGAVRALSYTALAQYVRCGYRFYAERVLGLPARPASGHGSPGDTRLEMSATERGTIVHALLERLDFRRPKAPASEAIALLAGRALPEAETSRIAQLISGFTGGELYARLGRASRVRTEQPFGFLLGETMITGVFDVLAHEQGGHALVLDYKTDRLEGASTVELVEASYSIQRLIYALAALRDGARRVEVVHVFLEQPEAPVVATYSRDDIATLEDTLTELVGRVQAGVFLVSDEPHRGLCSGCPAEGGLCSWPLALTRRDRPDRLF